MLTAKEAKELSDISYSLEEILGYILRRVKTAAQKGHYSLSLEQQLHEDLFHWCETRGEVDLLLQLNKLGYKTDFKGNHIVKVITTDSLTNCTQSFGYLEISWE